MHNDDLHSAHGLIRGFIIALPISLALWCLIYVVVNFTYAPL